MCLCDQVCDPSWCPLSYANLIASDKGGLYIQAQLLPSGQNLSAKSQILLVIVPTEEEGPLDVFFIEEVDHVISIIPC